jgi:hypothetical protein
MMDAVRVIENDAETYRTRFMRIGVGPDGELFLNSDCGYSIKLREVEGVWQIVERKTSGITPSEMGDILWVIESNAEVTDKRVLQMSNLPDGDLILRGGEILDMRSGSGYTVKLRKVEGVWQVVERTAWAS